MSGDPHTVPRARSGASRGKVCYRVLAASAVLVCTCSRGAQPRSAPRVATARAASALARCSMVCRGATHCGPGGLLHRRPRDLHRTGRTFAARRSGASHGAGRWPPHVLSCDEQGECRTFDRNQVRLSTVVQKLRCVATDSPTVTPASENRGSTSRGKFAPRCCGGRDSAERRRRGARDA